MRAQCMTSVHGKYSEKHSYREWQLACCTLHLPEIRYIDD